MPYPSIPTVLEIGTIAITNNVSIQKEAFSQVEKKPLSVSYMLLTSVKVEVVAATLPKSSAYLIWEWKYAPMQKNMPLNEQKICVSYANRETMFHFQTKPVCHPKRLLFSAIAFSPIPRTSRK